MTPRLLSRCAFGLAALTIVASCEPQQTEPQSSQASTPSFLAPELGEGVSLDAWSALPEADKAAMVKAVIADSVDESPPQQKVDDLLACSKARVGDMSGEKGTDAMTLISSCFNSFYDDDPFPPDTSVVDRVMFGTGREWLEATIETRRTVLNERLGHTLLIVGADPVVMEQCITELARRPGGKWRVMQDIEEECEPRAGAR